MRVTLVTRIYAPEPAAASFRLAALVQALEGRGAAVTVATTTTGPTGRGASSKVPGRVKRWPAARDKAGYVRGYVPYLSFDIPAFFRVLAGGPADVVVAEPPPTTGLAVRIACALRRIPYVYYAADIWSDATASTGAPRLVTAVVRAMERFALRGAGAVIAVTDGVAARVRDLAGHDRCVVVRNGVDTQIFTPHAAAPTSLPRAVYVGTTSEWQGAEVLLRGFAQTDVAGAELIFVGQGSEWSRLEHLAVDLGIADRVQFVPTVPPAAAARYLASAWVAMVSIRPDIGYDFAYPTKVNAALACGTRVLYAGPGPAARVVRDTDAGWVCGYGTDQVAAALTDALADPPNPATRRRIAHWAEQNVSIARTAELAAGVVEQVAVRRERTRTRTRDLGASPGAREPAPRGRA
ncbi:glycosyltransferase [Rarobacter incanus]|uniref:D-inositol 3-phosphate glycosyltransferase n=1 Tax=Rarobacter incanus TaxID=153494 RepID=A0A542SNT2_9MICO|nr:glycosyltransferase [Rarobacter incanus]TQK76242.1 glycosyltransferase involved in cell wall biosynthesis [Rarobacter incanus]